MHLQAPHLDKSSSNTSKLALNLGILVMQEYLDEKGNKQSLIKGLKGLFKNKQKEKFLSRDLLNLLLKYIPKHLILSS